MAENTMQSGASSASSSDPDTQALLEQWNKAVQESMHKLDDHEKEEILKFQGPDEIEADLRERLHNMAQGTIMQGLVSQISPFFHILQELFRFLAFAMPSRSIHLSLVSGGAYLTVKKYSEFEQISNRIVTILDNFKNELILVKGCYGKLANERWRVALIHMFMAMIDFWVISVRILSRTSHVNQFFSDRGFFLDQQLKVAMSKIQEELSHLQRLQQFNPMPDNLSLAKSQTKILQQRSRIEQSAVDSRCFDLGGSRNELFLGRSQDLKQIEDAMNTKTADALCITVISGGGGAGKTAVAREAAYRLRDSGRFDFIFWVNAENNDVLRLSFENIARRLSLMDTESGSEKDKHFMLVKHWMMITAQHWLFIYDNVVDFNLVNEFLPAETGSMIVTTRFDTSSHSLEGNVSRIRLRNLAVGDSLQLFNRIRSSLHPTCNLDADEEETKELLESIDGLALGIKQMAFFIGNKKWPIAKFRKLYTSAYTNNEDGLKFKFMKERHPAERHSLGALWDVHFQYITGTGAARLLGMLSLASSVNFPRQVLELEEGLTEEEEAWAAERLRDGTSDLTDDEIGWADLCQDLLELDEAIDLLSKNALLDNLDDADQLHMHRLTGQAFLYSPRGLISSTGGRNNFQMAFAGLLFLLARKFPHAGLKEGMWRHQTKCAEYIPHVVTLARTLNSSQNSGGPDRAIRAGINFVRLMIDAAWYLFEIHELEECKEMLDIASKACEDKRSLEYGFICNTYVCIALHKNDIEAGRRYSELAIKIREAKLPAGHVTLAHSYNNFGSNLLNECRYNDAITHFFMAEKIETDNNRDGGPIVMSINGMNAMARAYALKGDLTKAAKQIQDVRECLRLTEMEHTLLNVATEYNWTTRILAKQRKFDEALSGLKKIRELAKAKMPTSLELYSIYHKIGILYLQIDRPNFAKARDAFEAGIQVARLHKREPEIARSEIHLAETLRKNPDASEADREEADKMEARAKAVKNARWATICPLIQGGADATDIEQYDLMVSAWWR